MTSSKTAALVGSQVPTKSLVPKAYWSHADDAAFLAAGYGLTLDPWQFVVLEGWLGETRASRWTCGRCGISVPRQNGKNAIIEVRELYGMVVLGEKFLHTAHEMKTTRKAFLRLKRYFGEKPDDPRALYPELNAMVVEVRKTNGQEMILLTNGGSIEFVARSRGSGRGFTVDVLVIDEAQELTDEQFEALQSTISSAPLGNPQTLFAGTPPPPGSPGEVFARVRAAALEDKAPRLSWHEWSYAGAVDKNINRDRTWWEKTNPSLGRRLNVETLEDELGLSDEGFARERLGRWPANAVKSVVIDKAAWKAAGTNAPRVGGTKSFAVDMSPDRSMIAIAACVKYDDGTAHVELARHESTSLGTGWVVPYLKERWPDTAAIVIDEQSPAKVLVPDLVAAKVKVTVTNADGMSAACGRLFDAVKSRRVTHYDHPTQKPLDDALANAKKRAIGMAGGWGWDRKDPTIDITPLVAATLALHGAMTSKRRPGRSVRVLIPS